MYIKHIDYEVRQWRRIEVDAELTDKQIAELKEFLSDEPSSNDAFEIIDSITKKAYDKPIDGTERCIEPGNYQTAEIFSEDENGKEKMIWNNFNEDVN